MNIFHDFAILDTYNIEILCIHFISRFDLFSRFIFQNEMVFLRIGHCNTKLFLTKNYGNSYISCYIICIYDKQLYHT